MKQFLTIFCLLCAFSAAFAQGGAPKKFNYQAVPRKADGTLLAANTIVKIQFVLTEDGPVTIKYGEEHVTTVSQHGVVNAIVGGGATSGVLPFNFDAVDWANHSYFLSVNVDLNGNGSFESTEKFASSQLLSVPYALYAEKSGGGGSGGGTNYKWGNGLDIDSTTFTINNTGDVNADDDVLKTSNFSAGDVSGSFNTGLEIKPNAVTGAEIMDNSIQKEDLSAMGAANGQVMKFNSATGSWEPGDDLSGGGGGGSTVISGGTGITVTQNGTGNFTITNTGDPNAGDDLTNTSAAGGDLNGNFSNLQINAGVVGSTEIQNGSIEATDLGQMGAATGQVLSWDGSKWLPVTPSGGPGGGLTSVAVNAPLAGNGTLASPIFIQPEGIDANLIKNGTIGTAELGQMGASPGHVMKWNGSTWEPQNDIGGGTGDNWGTQSVQTNATLSGNGVSGNTLGIAQQGASTGQVLKWNGTAWLPQNDETGGPGGGLTQVAVTAPLTGNGTPVSPVAIAPNGISGGLIQDGSVTATDLEPGLIPTSLPPSGAASGDLSGNYPGPTVSGIQNFPVNPTAPASGQVLKWDGTEWTPSTDATSTGGSGLTTVAVSAPLAGDGTAANPINIPANSIGGNLIQNNSITSADLAPGTVPIAMGGAAITVTYVAGNTSFNIHNTAPDQVVALTGSGGTTVTGSYPNFNIHSPNGGGGGGNIGGSGTAGYLSKFTSANDIGNSQFFQTGSGEMRLIGGRLEMENGGQKFNMALRADGKMAFEADGVTGDNTLVIDDDGDQSVNIGTATPIPGFKLHVVGKAKFDNGVYLGSNEYFIDGGSNEIATNADLRPTIHSTGTNGYDLGKSAFRWRTGYLNKGFFNDGVGIGTGVTGLANAELRVVGSDSDGSTTAAVKIESPGNQTMLLDGNEIDVPGGALYIHSNSDKNVYIAKGGGAVGIDRDAIDAGFKLHVGGKAKFDNGVFFGSIEGFTDGGADQIASNATIRPTIDATATTGDNLGLANFRWKDVNAFYGKFGKGLKVGPGITNFDDTAAHLSGDESDGNQKATLKIESPSQSMFFDGNEIDCSTGSLFLQNNSTSDLQLCNGGGQVSIGGAVSGANKLTVHGTAAKNSGGSTWATFSDRRLKTDINPYTAGIEVLEKIRPVTFHYSGKLGENTAEKHVGIIAQEVQEVAPYMVENVAIREGGEAGQSYLQFNANAFTYLLINSVKSQQAEIVDLRSKLEAQQAQLDLLMKTVGELAAKNVGSRD